MVDGGRHNMQHVQHGQRTVSWRDESPGAASASTSVGSGANVTSGVASASTSVGSGANVTFGVASASTSVGSGANVTFGVAPALASAKSGANVTYVHEHEHEHQHGQEQQHGHSMAFHTWWAPAAASRPLAAPWRWLQLAVEASQRATDSDDESSVGATDEAAATAVEPQQPKVLHLFAGQRDLPKGLAAQLRKLGLLAEEIDNDDECVWLGREQDLLIDAVFEALLARAQAGEFAGIVAGVPCSTFSVARFKPGGAPVVRRKPGEERGLHHPPPGHDREAANANLLLQRTVEIIRAIHSCGGFFVVENPIDRSDAELSARFRLGHWPKHASLWAMSEIEELQKATKAKVLHFPQCSLGQVAQKFTTLMFSAELDLSALDGLTCTHSRQEHRWSNKRNADGSWATAALAAYPPELNKILAEALAAAISQKRVTTPHFRPGQRAWWASSDGGTVRECSVVGVHWDDSDPYYTADFGGGQMRDTNRQHLREVAPPVVGCRRPHAGAAAAASGVPDSTREASSSSLRRNEPELEQILEVEALPAPSTCHHLQRGTTRQQMRRQCQGRSLRMSSSHGACKRKYVDTERA